MRAALPETPAAPQLRAIREAWLGQAVECLEADPAITAAGLVGSLGRGDADDWSDIDLLIFVPDDQVGHYADATRLPGSDQATWSVDARHNVPRGAGAVSVCYIIFDPDGLPRLNDTFDEHQEKRELQPPTPKAASAHRLLQVSLLPVAAKYVARRSADAGRMVRFVGGSDSPEATPAERLAMLRRLLAQYRDDAPDAMLAAASRYLDLVEGVL